MTSRRGAWVAVVAVTALIATACETRITRSASDVFGEGPPMQEPVITLGIGNVTPQVLHLINNRTVTLVNADTRVRTIFGDAHPGHATGDCGPANIGPLTPGERRDVTFGPAPHVLCYFHEETEPARADLQGVVVLH